MFRELLRKKKINKKEDNEQQVDVDIIPENSETETLDSSFSFEEILSGLSSNDKRFTKRPKKWFDPANFRDEQLGQLLEVAVSKGKLSIVELFLSKKYFSDIQDRLKQQLNDFDFGPYEINGVYNGKYNIFMLSIVKRCPKLFKWLVNEKKRSIDRSENNDVDLFFAELAKTLHKKGVQCRAKSQFKLAYRCFWQAACLQVDITRRDKTTENFYTLAKYRNDVGLSCYSNRSDTRQQLAWHVAAYEIANQIPLEDRLNKHWRLLAKIQFNLAYSIKDKERAGALYKESYANYHQIPLEQRTQTDWNALADFLKEDTNSAPRTTNVLKMNISEKLAELEHNVAKVKKNNNQLKKEVKEWRGHFQGNSTLFGTSSDKEKEVIVLSDADNVKALTA